MYLDVKGHVSTGIGNEIDESARDDSAPTESERALSLAAGGRLRWLVDDVDTDATPEDVALDRGRSSPGRGRRGVQVVRRRPPGVSLPAPVSAPASVPGAAEDAGGIGGRPSARPGSRTGSSRTRSCAARYFASPAGR